MDSLVLVLIGFGAFFVYHCWCEYRHARERQELYSRLMARNLLEYQATTNQERDPPKPARSFIKLPVEKAGEE